MRSLPLIATDWLKYFIIISALFGISIDYLFGNKIDYWIHDIALVFQARTEWKYTGVVALDEGVPIAVSRRQTLPLYARATEQLISAGAKAVYLDARLSKENEAFMPYALCIEKNGEVNWSLPLCLPENNRCKTNNSKAGDAPLKMSMKAFPFFRMAPFIDENQANLPNFLLFGWDDEGLIPVADLVAFDRLTTKNAAVARWMDLSINHANTTMASFINPDRVANIISEQAQEDCEKGIPCQRVRFSYPKQAFQFSTKSPMIPVSELASCDPETALMAASMFKDRIAILQLTTLTESTDSIITPMTTALMGPNLLTPGAQYLADSIETLLNNDHPVEPNIYIKIIIFMSMAIVGVLASAYFKHLSLIWGLGILLFGMMVSFCLFIPVIQLWPVTASLITFATGVLLTLSLHLLIGLSENKLLQRYMPQKVHNLLFSLRPDRTFTNKHQLAIILMSDLKGYTTITSILKEPILILNLMNDYLDRTTTILQDKYEGWLETYVGDMVFYYWPYEKANEESSFQNALLGAIKLAELQKEFFSNIPESYKNSFDPDQLHNMQQTINAGIGLSCGLVVMGDLGPKQGVRKFGILGDPVNLASRLESLTRYFNAEIIVTSDFLPTIYKLPLMTRRLGYFQVKETVLIYALGTPDDPRFEKNILILWDSWLSILEQSSTIGNLPPQLEIFRKDFESFSKWYMLGLYNNGRWLLSEK